MSNFSALQRAYDRMEPDTREDDAYDSWLESTSFVDMLPESIINNILELVLINYPDKAMETLYAAVNIAWKKHQKDAAREAGERRAEDLADRWAA